MHELPFAKSIYQNVMKVAEENRAQKVLKVQLEVGELRDFIPELVQKYWDYIAAGSIAEGAEIEMTIIRATASCRDCGTVYTVDVAHMQSSRCPQCGCDIGTLLTGRELKIMNIEII